MAAIVLFRDDLRVDDNPAFIKALESDLVIPIFVYEPEFYGSANKVYLYNALNSLDEKLFGKLNYFHGSEGELFDFIKSLQESYSIDSVFWNRRYHNRQIEKDKALKKKLTESGFECESFKGTLFKEPWQIKKSDGSCFKVFTPFFKAWLQSSINDDFKPEKAEFSSDQIKKICGNLDELNLLPKNKWHEKFSFNYSIDGAIECFESFLNRIDSYKDKRDFPSINATSGLSPYFRFGQISLKTIFNSLNFQDNNHLKFISEIAWREFAYHVFFHFPYIESENYNASFNQFPWVDNDFFLKSWQKGEVGIPMVDAGMKELWQTGTMHNRVRMITASFLIKNLLIDWRKGKAWFDDCLFDADFAVNSFSWQWVAGSGFDAAPYFRVFNPILQGKKFDSQAVYIKKFLPELEKLEAKDIFSDEVTGYIRPIVSLSESRKEALSAWESIR